MGTHPIFESDFDCLTAMGDVWHHRKNLPDDLISARGSLGNIICSNGSNMPGGNGCKYGSMHTDFRILGPDKKNVVGRSIVIYSTDYSTDKSWPQRPMACAQIVLADKELDP